MKWNLEKSAVLPDNWNTAGIITFFKEDFKSNPGNYRPVRLVCIVCTILGSVVRDALVKHFDNKVYIAWWYSFRGNRSLELLEIMANVTSLLNETKDTDILRETVSQINILWRLA